VEIAIEATRRCAHYHGILTDGYECCAESIRQAIRTGEPK
jgi:hypothetical protein